MYLLKPENGFYIPVIYVRKEDLNIYKLKELSSAEKESDYLKTEDNASIVHNHEKAKREENWVMEMRSEDTHILFDADEGRYYEKSIENIINRKSEKIEPEAVGLLILDDEVIEEESNE